jgi:hypothetical protein
MPIREKMTLGLEGIDITDLGGGKHVCGATTAITAEVGREDNVSSLNGRCQWRSFR